VQKSEVGSRKDDGRGKMDEKRTGEREKRIRETTDEHEYFEK
jgi:hypothetical protein